MPNPCKYDHNMCETTVGVLTRKEVIQIDRWFVGIYGDAEVSILDREARLDHESNGQSDVSL